MSVYLDSLDAPRRVAALRGEMEKLIASRAVPGDGAGMESEQISVELVAGFKQVLLNAVKEIKDTTEVADTPSRVTKRSQKKAKNASRECDSDGRWFDVLDSGEIDSLRNAFNNLAKLVYLGQERHIVAYINAISKLKDVIDDRGMNYYLSMSKNDSNTICAEFRELEDKILEIADCLSVEVKKEMVDRLKSATKEVPSRIKAQFQIWDGSRLFNTLNSTQTLAEKVGFLVFAAA